MTKRPAVYILASRKHGTLYVGVTSALVKRIWEHKNDCAKGFTKRYGVYTLVWYEQHETMESAISKEKAIKEWKPRILNGKTCMIACCRDISSFRRRPESRGAKPQGTWTPVFTGVTVC